MRGGRAGFGMELAANVFPAAQERLLQMVIFSSHCEYGISVDRLDAAANALLTLIAMDNERFKAYAHTMISQQQPMVQPQLVAAFEKLSTARGVSMVHVEKSNRIIFVQNLKEFVSEVRPLVVFIT